MRKSASFFFFLGCVKTAVEQRSRDEYTSLQQEAVVVMPEDSPGVKVSAVRDTYGAEAGVQSSAKQWPFLIFFGIQDSHLFWFGREFNKFPGLAAFFSRFASARLRRKHARRCQQIWSVSCGRSMVKRRRRRSTQIRSTTVPMMGALIGLCLECWKYLNIFASATIDL